MKLAVIILWNALLLLVVIACAWAILPRAMGQFTDLDKLPFGTFKARVIMIGFEGFGLFLAFATTAVSLCSFFWRDISRRWRIAFINVFAALTIGTLVDIGIAYLDMWRYTEIDVANHYGDYIAFWVSIGLSLFPVLLFGRSYPNLVFAAASRILRGNSQSA